MLHLPASLHHEAPAVSFSSTSRASWSKPTILELRRLGKKDREFEVSPPNLANQEFKACLSNLDTTSPCVCLSLLCVCIYVCIWDGLVLQKFLVFNLKCVCMHRIVSNYKDKKLFKWTEDNGRVYRKHSNINDKVLLPHLTQICWGSGDTSVGKSLVVQVWEPKFESQESKEKSSGCGGPCNPRELEADRESPERAG